MIDIYEFILDKDVTKMSVKELNEYLKEIRSVIRDNSIIQ